MENTEKLVYTFTEMIEQLGIGRTTGYKLVAQEGFPAIKVGSKYLIPVDGLREWLKSNQGKQLCV